MIAAGSARRFVEGQKRPRAVTSPPSPPVRYPSTKRSDKAPSRDPSTLSDAERGYWLLRVHDETLVKRRSVAHEGTGIVSERVELDMLGLQLGQRVRRCSRSIDSLSKRWCSSSSR